MPLLSLYSAALRPVKKEYHRGVTGTRATAAAREDGMEEKNTIELEMLKEELRKLKREVNRTSTIKEVGDFMLLVATAAGMVGVALIGVSTLILIWSRILA